ncbi:hypothetical protein QLQ12_38505 [Actinoplanes sp. NEAU-A12]|uniref:DUF2567 domain-containing protein n=1 Tax=Actinoplanes sandaracinus TaxID=3045177 RepID=A0ABT6WXN5_9ACTN|nr:hypothetical protein [Actinoplanes sandaracinus]MDI6104498.1 hypothetical protein [Actinoplanes sandaracinus]
MVYPSEQPAGQSPVPDGIPPAAGEPSGASGRPGRDWRQWLRFHQSSPRPWRRTLSVTVGVATSIAVLGVLLGLGWAWLAPTVPVVNAGRAGVVVTDPSPEQYIAADGWFTLLGLGFGLIVTIGAWLVLRRDRGPFLLLGVVGGTFLAGRWVAPAIGQFLGRDAYDRWQATAAQGATYLAPPEVQSLGPKLVPAFVAAIVLTLLAGWSNDPDLDLPGAHPGYGHQHAYPPPYETSVADPAGTPGFGEPGFGQSGFDQPGSGRPGSEQSGYGPPGFGSPYVPAPPADPSAAQPHGGSEQPRP